MVNGNARDKIANSGIDEDYDDAWSDILDKEADDGVGDMITTIWIPILNKSHFKRCHCL